MSRPTYRDSRLVVKVGGCSGVEEDDRLAAQLAAHAMHGPRRTLEALEQRFAHEAVVRALVVGRHAAFVAPPETGLRPVRLQLRCELVRRPGRGPSRQRDVLAAVRCGDEQLGRRVMRLGCGLEDSVQDSPRASSRERSIAAWIAFKNAARTPARSSSRIARIVVPPGEVTISRSST